MNGKYLSEMSWEKQHFYLLDNGHIVRIEHGYYGPMVVAIHSQGSNKILFHCSNGLETAPGWLREWETPIYPGHWQTIIAPNFNRIN